MGPSSNGAGRVPTSYPGFGVSLIPEPFVGATSWAADNDVDVCCLPRLPFPRAPALEVPEEGLSACRFEIVPNDTDRAVTCWSMSVDRVGAKEATGAPAAIKPSGARASVARTLNLTQGQKVQKFGRRNCYETDPPTPHAWV
ncbi:hypothetical protein L1887_62821 [Cichorium endivia]|nr:hypothetical protein L1887_62821 [Cichorium endivia]